MELWIQQANPKSPTRSSHLHLRLRINHNHPWQPPRDVAGSVYSRVDNLPICIRALIGQDVEPSYLQPSALSSPEHAGVLDLLRHICVSGCTFNETN
jgi:hypothetical protein